MSRRRGLGTIYWAFVWISLGTVLLLRNLGYSIPIWEGLARYWPVLIIALRAMAAGAVPRVA